MRLPALMACVIAALWLPFGLRAQRSGAAQLLLRVEPDAELSHPRVALRLRVGPASEPGAARQTEVITARVRALPGQRIRLLARVSALAGPDGEVPAYALRWAGRSVSPDAPAGRAACGSGAFQDGAPSDLVNEWTRSGTISCEITFTLAEAARLPIGIYSGVVDLALRVE